MLQGTFLVDAHVHFYGCFDEARFFDGALANFRAGARQLGAPDETVGWLLFTEAAGDDFFQRFRERGTVAAGWSFRETGEDCSLAACRDGERKMILVAGRQIKTKERFEVLAIGSCAGFADGLPLEATLEAVRASDALTVLPWGFGKWWFGRGARLAALLRSADLAGVHLGDNGGRPRPSLRPRIFALGRGRGLLILPGSDPLPLAAEAGKVARYGFALEGRIDPAAPAAGLKRLIGQQRRQPAAFGRRERLDRFCRGQIQLRLAKRGLAERPVP